ncbi:hypothetical protein EYR36_005738 [Pleurotus pulmonarius]|nr:hypothetical protein EYR36_005738 [Pleurotus pulmonarius]
MDMSSFAPYMYEPLGAATRYEEGSPDFDAYFNHLAVNPLGATITPQDRYERSMAAVARELASYTPGTIPLPEDQAWDGPVLPLLPPYEDYGAPVPAPVAAPRNVAEDDLISPELRQLLDEHSSLTHTWTPMFEEMGGLAPRQEFPQLLPPFPPSVPSGGLADGPVFGLATKGRYAGRYVEIPKALPPLGKLSKNTSKKDTPYTVQEKAPAQEKAKGKAQEQKKKTRSSIQKQAIRGLQQKNRNKPQLLCGSYMNICLNSLKYCTSFLTRPALTKQRPRWFSVSSCNARPQTRHEPTLRQAHAQRRLQISKIYSMLVHLSKRIPDLEHDHDQLQKWAAKRLSLQEFTGKYLPRAYEEAIRFLMSERYYAEAVVLYRQMLDQGLLPSSATNSTVTALSVAAAGASGSDLLKALEVTLTDPRYTESSLLQLLDFLAKLLLPSTLRMQVARRFVESRAEDYTPSMELVTRLVMSQAKDGLLRESLDWIVRGNDDERPVATTRESARLYKQLLSHLKKTKPDDSEAVDTILSHMKSNKVPVSTSVFNMLISMQARRGASSQAFSLYNVLVEVSKSQPLYPDSFTFGTLFSLIQSLRSPGNRNARRRRFKEAANVLSPRTLYQHLLHYGKRDIRTHVVTPSILNVALRTFLTVRDYAAAFVVIRTFPTLQLHPNRDTYYVVMKLLMDRIRYDLWQARNPKEARWGDHMLGIDPADAPTTTVDDSLAETVLAFGKQPGGRPIRMPTLAQIDNEEEILSEDVFDTLPLERVLKRAILADMMIQGHTVALSSSVSGAIVRAKEEMVTPPNIVLGKTDFRRKRRR